MNKKYSETFQGCISMSKGSFRTLIINSSFLAETTLSRAFKLICLWNSVHLLLRSCNQKSCLSCRWCAYDFGLCILPMRPTTLVMRCFTRTQIVTDEWHAGTFCEMHFKRPWIQLICCPWQNSLCWNECPAVEPRGNSHSTGYQAL